MESMTAEQQQADVCMMSGDKARAHSMKMHSWTADPRDQRTDGMSQYTGGADTRKK